MHDCLVSASADFCECCAAPRCRDAGCQLSLPTGGGVRRILSGSAIQRNHGHMSKLCDFLFFACRRPRDVACAIELKNGKFDLAKVAEQLQAGADLVNSLAVSPNAVSFYPILVHSRGMTAIARKVIATRRIRYGNSEYRILTAKCGSSLADVVPVQNST